jgi:hypothetical protein
MSAKQFPALIVVVLALSPVGLAQPAPPQRPPSPAEVERLVAQLGSSSYAEREAAAARLKGLGQPAHEALRRAALSKDPEVRRRAGRLLDELLEEPFSKAFSEGVAHLNKKDYRKAVAALKNAAELYEKTHPTGWVAAGQPFLTETYLHLARAHRGLAETEAACRAYHRATYHAGRDQRRRDLIEREPVEMVRGLLAGWQKEVRARVSREPALKVLTEKYPLVVLHSRRFAPGGYFRCAYSFIYETADEDKHRNDVQLQFDNGGSGSRLDINMLGGQQNLIVDLGRADFVRDPDPRKIDPDGDNFWVPGDCKAVEGHVYLERVRDSSGNKFYVVFQCLAVDKDSRYMAFVWRRLPGGKVVKQP